MLVLGLALLNIACNVGAIAFFAASGHASGPELFVLWQIVGGLFGLKQWLGSALVFVGLVLIALRPAGSR